MDKMPKVGVGCLIIEGGRILLGKRKGSHGDGQWSDFGGHLEHGETFESCIKRELKEEIGIEVKNLKMLCVSNVIRGGAHYVDIEFAGKIKSGKPRIVEHEKIGEIRWFPLNRVPKNLFVPCRLGLKALKTKKMYFSVKGRTGR
ncbi:MAG: NUDIX domain-containing protein [Candidatus Aenigmarchaeota archaeon]|nr:NUDIX domain-containing protein [Candidatus Aenigmarchaeota archaeon]